MKTPVAVFLYRRPEQVRGLMARLQLVRPERVWLVADGPKNPGEADLCRWAREEAEKAVNWPCEVIRVYAETNLGLRNRLETGLDAVFAREEAAILLEEDCHPTDDFFPFCEAMLERYREEPRAGGISGNCFLPAGAQVKGDYFFSRYLHIWGWATWARAWKGYERARWEWPAGGLRELFPDAGKKETDYWNRVYARVAAGEIDTWDYRWVADLWRRGMFSITPSQNLVANRGFGAGATHTRDASVETGIEREASLHPPYRGPARIEADPALDRLVFENHFLRTEGRRSLWQKMRGRLAGAFSEGR